MAITEPMVEPLPVPASGMPREVVVDDRKGAVRRGLLDRGVVDLRGPRHDAGCDFDGVVRVHRDVLLATASRGGPSAHIARGRPGTASSARFRILVPCAFSEHHAISVRTPSERTAVNFGRDVTAVHPRVASAFHTPVSEANTR